jgi:hypothetical protein
MLTYMQSHNSSIRVCSFIPFLPIKVDLDLCVGQVDWDHSHDHTALIRQNIYLASFGNFSRDLNDIQVKTKWGMDTVYQLAFYVEKDGLLPVCWGRGHMAGSVICQIFQFLVQFMVELHRSLDLHGR